MDKLRRTAGQIAFGYGVAMVVVLAASGIFIMWSGTDYILDAYNEKKVGLDQYNNDTYLEGNQIRPEVRENETQYFNRSYNHSVQLGFTIIFVGLAFLLLAEGILYVPISLAPTIVTRKGEKDKPKDSLGAK